MEETSKNNKTAQLGIGDVSCCFFSLIIRTLETILKIIEKYL